MIVRKLHRWEVSPAEARAIQEKLRRQVVIAPFRANVRLVAAVDVACPRMSRTAIAGVVVMSVPKLEVVERRFAVSPLRFPYVPGLLSFREGEPVCQALEKIQAEPDLFLFDGQGICHPRRFGLASHIGLLLDRPSAGCAKSLLLGKHLPLGERVGSRRQLLDNGEVVGAALRTRSGVKPVYVSPGHKTDLASALQVVKRVSPFYRIPEPLREAHRWVTELSRTGTW